MPLDRPLLLVDLEEDAEVLFSPVELSLVVEEAVAVVDRLVFVELVLEELVELDFSVLVVADDDEDMVRIASAPASASEAAGDELPQAASAPSAPHPIIALTACA